MIWPLASFLFFQHVLLDGSNVEKNPHTSATDIASGRTLYAGRCAGCHGPEGDGGKGTNLATPMLPRAQTDQALYRVISRGLPDTEMPGHNLTPKEIWQISAFVRSLGRTGSEHLTGDVARGAAIVRGKGGCLQCHVVNGEGGLMGPALTDIAVRRSPSYVRRKILEPGKDLAGDFRLVQLTTRSGEKLSGIRMNEDTFSVQVRDMNNKPHSFWKRDLAELNVETRTMMPSYAEKFSKQELNDVVTYLMSLRGQQ
jgi:putative heme-binding domain-containing protein